MTAPASPKDSLDLAGEFTEIDATRQQPWREAWRSLPAGQQPDWPDRAQLAAVTAELAGLPPLVFAGECDLLIDRIAAVTRGEAFVLQGGDCAETFAGSTASAVRAAADGGRADLRSERAGREDRPNGRPIR
jgi:hypothetical protein